MHSMEKWNKSEEIREIGFSGIKRAKTSKTRFKSVFIDGKKYTKLVNRKFDLFFPIFHDFTRFFKTRKSPKN